MVLFGETKQKLVEREHEIRQREVSISLEKSKAPSSGNVCLQSPDFSLMKMSLVTNAELL